MSVSVPDTDIHFCRHGHRHTFLQCILHGSMLGSFFLLLLLAALFPRLLLVVELRSGAAARSTHCRVLLRRHGLGFRV
jgi:hypothetical protein